MTRFFSVALLCAALIACEKAAVAKTPEEAKRLIRLTGCTNCHDKERPLVGPPFSAVAARYAGQPTAEAALARSIVEGSQGKWGPMAMPAQTRLEPEERRAMIRWILDLHRADDRVTHAPAGER